MQSDLDLKEPLVRTENVVLARACSDTDGQVDGYSRGRIFSNDAGHGHSHGSNNSSGRPCSHTDGHSHGHSHDVGPQVSVEGSWEAPQPLSQSLKWLRAHDPAECPSHLHVASCDTCHSTCEMARCDHSELNVSTNIIVLARVHELTTMSRVNTLLALIAVLYIAMNIIGFILNSYDNDCNPSKDLSCSPATTPQTFHNLEFWSAFVFNTVDLLALFYSPKKLSNQYDNPTTLKLIVLFNIGLSFCACMLVSINVEKFEVLAHEMEYLNELTVSIFDVTILLSLLQGRVHQSQDSGVDQKLSRLSMGAATLIAIAQLGIYNCSGWTRSGDSKGETLSHKLEFTFGIISSFITFWFTMDNRMSADQRLRSIMYPTGGHPFPTPP